MNTIFHPRRQCASTMTDVLLVVVSLVLLAVVLLPMLAPAKSHSRIRCGSNLKQVGLAFILWSTDNGGPVPWMTSTNGGTIQFADSTNVFLYFRAASNELNTPKILVCPQDPAKSQATAFDNLVNQNLSYFMGLTANANDPQSILSGDRNLTTNGVAMSNGVFQLATNIAMGWTAAIHKNVGNICLADGSVQQVNSTNLQAVWLASTNTARRLAIP